MASAKSTRNRKRQLLHIEKYGSDMPIAYASCRQASCNCRISMRSGKCYRCVKDGLAGCDIRVTAKEFGQFRTAREKLAKQLLEARKEHDEILRRLVTQSAKIQRLQTQLDFANNKEDNAIEQDLVLEEAEDTGGETTRQEPEVIDLAPDPRPFGSDLFGEPLCLSPSKWPG